MTRHVMMTITGPSCSGKTTLMKRLLTESTQFVCLQADTTRPRRSGESDLEYNFIDVAEFDAAEYSGYYCQTVDYCGIRYGTRWSTIEHAFADNKVPLRIVEPSGVDQFRRAAAECLGEVVSVYVDEDQDIILSRWIERVAKEGGSADVDFFTKRIMTTLTTEVNWIHKADYDFYFDLRYKPEHELVYALTRIAKGAMPLGQVRQISPRVSKVAA